MATAASAADQMTKDEYLVNEISRTLPTYVKENDVEQSAGCTSFGNIFKTMELIFTKVTKILLPLRINIIQCTYVLYKFNLILIVYKIKAIKFILLCKIYYQKTK